MCHFVNLEINVQFGKWILPRSCFPDGLGKRGVSGGSEIPERAIVTIDQHANTSSASIPLALDVGIRSQRIHKGQTLLLEAFAAGFVWGATLVRL